MGPENVLKTAYYLMLNFCHFFLIESKAYIILNLGNQSNMCFSTKTLVTVPFSPNFLIHDPKKLQKDPHFLKDPQELILNSQEMSSLSKNVLMRPARPTFSRYGHTLAKDI